MKLIVTGYNAAPSEKIAAAAYYNNLFRIANADGLGFDWNGPQAPAELSDVLAELPGVWSITVNEIPRLYARPLTNSRVWPQTNGP